MHTQQPHGQEYKGRALRDPARQKLNNNNIKQINKNNNGSKNIKPKKKRKNGKNLECLLD
jgi:hypothetical protein